MKMFRRHVKKELSAYCNGELGPAEHKRVAEHLLNCSGCRAEYEEVRLGSLLAERLPKLSAPSAMWSEIESLLDDQSDKAASAPAKRGILFGLGWPAIAGASIVLVGAVILGAIYLRDYGPRASWGVRSMNGAIIIDGERVMGGGRLGVGEVLETDSASRATISVGQIGEVELDPNSRVRLVEARLTEHRLALDRGKMHAVIWAPPKLFFVDTPSAEAVDLGCAYTLEVDDSNRSFLRVTLGWVALVRDGRESYVPRDAMCETRPSAGPGTPFFEDAPDNLKTALERFDFEEGGEAALAEVLAASRQRDTLTLWHLLHRTGDDQRRITLDRMIELVGLPRDVTREGVLELDAEMMESWKTELYNSVWFPWPASRLN
jgi:hypothetical protein